MIDWKPIDDAPKDGSPVWARGNNFGIPSKGQHYTWAFWNGEHWEPPMTFQDEDGGGNLKFLTHYMEQTP